jgi:hypothetical protein
MVRRTIAIGLLLAGSVSIAAQGQNTLTAEEKSSGWKLLFDGKSLAGWRGFKAQEVPSGWQVVDGVLTRVEDTSKKAGDIITAEQYKDFELALEWRIPKGGNSGIFFHVAEEGGDQAYFTGPEVQILDNANHKDGAIPDKSAGSNYALHAPVHDMTKPVGEWNAVRLIVRGPNVEQWLNGMKVVEYQLWSADWEARVKASKFKDMPKYGREKTGYIALQDHGNKVEFRNIKVRVLKDS